MFIYTWALADYMYVCYNVKWFPPFVSFWAEGHDVIQSKIAMVFSFKKMDLVNKSKFSQQTKVSQILNMVIKSLEGPHDNAGLVEWVLSINH